MIQTTPWGFLKTIVQLKKNEIPGQQNELHLIILQLFTATTVKAILVSGILPKNNI